MKLTGTARGRNQQELITDAHRQAKQFYGNDPFKLLIGETRAIAEYIDYMDGRTEPTTTTFEMDYSAESPATIQEEQ